MKTAKSFILPIILATLFFTSCSDYDNDYTVNQIQYEKAFYDVFGEIDPNQDWNLVKQLREQGKSTRAHNANSNMWGSEGYDVPAQPETFTENQRNIVRLYFQNNKFPQGEAFPYSEFFAQQIYHGKTKIDNGTASDCKEEYKNANNNYVSANMNHLKVNGEHINNFNGGCDKNTIMYMYDLSGELHFTYLNSENSEAEHENFVIISGETIDAWALEHLDIIHKAQRSESDCQQVEYESVAGRYFVGFDFEFATDGSIYNGDYLDFSYNGKDYHLPYLITNGNFYGGPSVDINESNQLPDNIKDWSEERKNTLFAEVCKYVDLGYLPVKNSNKWVKPSACSDGYYSDWVISITPGQHMIESALLVAEDLGSQDFDFNDIVLLLEHRRRKSGTSTDQLVITAMAAGGTLPSYIYYKPLRSSSKGSTNLEGTPETDGYDDWEWLWEWNGVADNDNNMSNGIHHMWSGQEDYLEPLNVDTEFKRKGYSWELDITGAIEVIRQSDDPEIRKYADSYVSYIFDFSRIQIRVGSPESDNIIRPIEHGVASDGTSAFLSANVPQMMLLPMTYEWAQECKFIGNAYPDFGKWVQSKTETEWYKNQVSELVTKRYTDEASEDNGGDNGGNNGGDNGGGDNTGQQQNADPELHWTNEISIVEYSTTIGYDTKSNGGVWVSLSDHNLADVTLDPNSKTLTIVPKPNANGTLVITLHQSNSGNDYRESSITMTVKVGKQEDTETGGSDNKDSEHGTSLSSKGDKVYSISDLLTAAGNSDYVIITVVADNCNWFEVNPAVNGSVAWNGNYQWKYENLSQDSNRTYCYATVPVSIFKEMQTAGYSQFYLNSGSIKEVYVKPTSSSAKHRTTRR